MKDSDMLLEEKQTDKTSEISPASDLISDTPGFWKDFLGNFWEVFKIILVALIIIIPIRLFIGQPFIVEGDSMSPNFYDGEYLIVDEISYRFAEPERGDVVIFHPPQDPKNYYIKRIIGLPGETIELKDGRIYIYNDEFENGKRLIETDYLINSQVVEEAKVTLSEDEYYVIGDNRDNSLDSRRFGAIKFSTIRGKAFLRAFPFNRLDIFKDPKYIYS